MNKSATTPMMEQYLGIKARYPDALLFYRMGDFYEMFFEDAVAASRALDIALTKRGKHDGEDIPMCGVPHHASEGYFQTLIRKGFRVAVCEQLETPAEAKKRGYKSVVKRDVVRLVTPGTLTEDSLLTARRNNFLAAFAEVRGQGALAWVDISTGAFSVMECPRVQLGPELARLEPSELLASESLEAEIALLVSDFPTSLTNLSRTAFDSTAGKKRLCSAFKVASLDVFGAFNRAEISAMSGLIEYLNITQNGNLPLLRKPTRDGQSAIMLIDATTRRSLEITRSNTGGKDGSLLATIDRTVTPSGARLLEQRLSSPSCEEGLINLRLDCVAFMYENTSFASDLRELLRAGADLERATSRLALDRGGPRDMASVRNTLVVADELAKLSQDMNLPKNLAGARLDLIGHDKLISLLEAALIKDPPMLARDGGFIASGYDTDLDDARRLRDEGRGIIAGMQSEYIDLTGIQALKIKHNNVLGYYIETTAAHAEKMLSKPMADTFIHKQTMANQVRFTTLALTELESKILNAGERALELEKRLYSSLKDSILTRANYLAAASNALAEFDLCASLADIAKGEYWSRPKLDDSRAFEIKGGRHPVVERALIKSDASFVANDCNLTKDAIWLLTGPNMAGKSTFLRQNALIAILAQIGSFVPAESAHIGVVSQVFSRVGASDDLARGRSTFMVEMVETAAILNRADDRSLVILDEIGRGTATYDGLSIAWATLEHLNEVNHCRAIFATHYHEMAGLAKRLDGVTNATVTVKEWDGEVIFLHEVKKGIADRSYGVQVARLAGLPDRVVERARIVLDALEKGEREGGGKRETLIDDLPLFALAPIAPVSGPQTSDLEVRLQDIIPDELTPKEALSLLYELKNMGSSAD